MIKKIILNLDETKIDLFKIYLLGGVAARVARENISIHVGHTTVPCVVHGGGAVGVSVTGRAVHTHDSEGVTVRLHAAEITLRGRLGNIHTVVRENSANQGKNNNSKKKLHFF